MYEELGLPGSSRPDSIQRSNRLGIVQYWNTWSGAGVLGSEAFDPIPFMKKMAEYGFPYGIKEM